MNKEKVLDHNFTSEELDKVLADKFLRTMGDSVLSTVIIEHLITKEGLNDPGEITNKKKIMESRQVLDSISK
jgi:hypothetical protein